MRTAKWMHGLGILALMGAAVVSEAQWGRLGSDVPVARLIANVTPYVQQHPNDARGYYVLGRIHSLAFAQNAEAVHVYYEADLKPNVSRPNPPHKSLQNKPTSELPKFPGNSSVLVAGKTKEALQAEERKHLLESIRNYAKATELAPKEALYLLGLGWMLEQAANAAPHGGPTSDDIKPHSDDWRTQALAAYHHAYDLRVAADIKKDSAGVGMDDQISLEAAEGILRLYKGHALSGQEETDRSRLQTNITKLKAIPHWVTPIIFPLRHPAALTTLMDSQRTVLFDLMGGGQKQRWPWVTAETGFLVWDPAHKGHITSGRQLFGSATWWMFWKSGYQALAALDNNHDGLLTGHELDGIAVWRDANGNGICDPGEVLTLRELGITAISVQSAGEQEGTLFNPNGLRRADGSYLPTYDWTPTSQM